ncbi:toll-like receptor 4 [Mytilus californianus]|uniref:toll-like receptor 4 n=1 Tax=Mytilus californianus TaxID=6549 RepID=UPI002246DB7D|nr:toll-like receptor 4 [Mytilus californianus]
MLSSLRTMYALLYICLRLQIGQTDPCKFDERCQCSKTSKGYVTVDCSWKNITKIQNLPKSTVCLNVSHNLIEYTSKRFFESAKYLSTLDLSFNKLSSITVATFNGLWKLRYLSLDNNELVYNNHTFQKETFRDLKSLSHLSLKNNNIRSNDCKRLPDDTIMQLSALEKLELDACVCGDDIFGKGFHYLKKLKSLVIRNNFICSMSKYTFRNTKNLQNVLIHGIGEISFRKGTFRHLRYLKHLEMSFDSKKGGIVSPVEKIAKDFIYTSIETLKLGQLKIPLHTFPLYILNKELYKNNITEICLTDNAGKGGHFPIPMGAPPQTLQILDLSNNSLTRFILDIKNFTRLILKQNLLGDFLSTESYFEKKTNEYFSMIETIDISQNDIKELAPFTFYSQPLLHHIDLSNNKIQDITFDLSCLLALEFLNLSNNRIKFFNESVMRTINTLVMNKQLTIDLSQNLLQCTCKTIPFLRWMIESNVLFVDLQEYSCTLEDGSIIILNPFEYKVLQLEKTCKSYLGLIIGVSLALLVVIMTVFTTLVYRYRWKIRYMYYMTKGKYSYQKISPDNDDEYTYDAFISYSEDDRSFVFNDCIEKLEKEENFRLCIHQRDFMPGQDITVNITNCIHTSRKTVCLITKKFLESYYCMFEFNMARMESIYSRHGRNILFLVFYEQILPKELPLVMLELVQKESYMEYPNDEQGNVVFWEKIQETLRTNVRA